MLNIYSHGDLRDHHGCSPELLKVNKLALRLGKGWSIKAPFCCFQCFALCEPQKVTLGRRLPFCLDVTTATFEKLDLMLRSVCDGLDSSQGVYPPPHQEQECIAIATLNLLKLQVSTVEPQLKYPGNTPGTPLGTPGLSTQGLA